MSRAKQKNSKQGSGVDPFDAADLARSAALEDAKNPDYVGDLLAIDSDEEHIASYPVKNLEHILSLCQRL